MDEFNYKKFVDVLGLEEGDVIDVASDLRSIMLYCREHKLKFQPNGLIDALMTAVGEKGTVMIRAFSWAFCKGEAFDIRATPSQVGSLGNIAMRRRDFQRTRHPIYSWVVAGKYQKELCQYSNKEAFGKGTPFEFLCVHNAKQLMLGNAETTGTTQLHHAEKLENVPYRFEKNFLSDYVDERGCKFSKEYSMYVRYLDIDVDNRVFDGKETQKKLLEKNIKYENYFNEDIYVSVCMLKPLTDFMQEDIRFNEGKSVVSVNGLEGYKEANVDYFKLARK